MTSLIKERRTSPRKANVVNLRATPRTLFDAICDAMGLQKDDVRGDRKTAPIAKARAVYSYLGREMKFTCTALANEMNRDHSTVLFHHKTYTNYLDESKPWFREDLKEEIDGIRFRLKVRLISC